MVLAGVSDKLPERISHAIYLDAFLPENGKSLSDYVPRRANEGERPAKLKPFTDAKGFGITDPNEIKWVNQRLTDQPGKTFTEPVTLRGADSMVRKSFIQLSEAPWFVEAANRARKNGYGYYDMKTAGHDAMISMPDELKKAIYTMIRS